MAWTRETENEIVGRLQQLQSLDTAGDWDDLAADVDRLFAMHQDRIYGACYRVLGDPELARDMAQEAMLVAWRKLPEFKGESRFGTWVYGIARNLCFNQIRKRGEMLSEDGVVDADTPEAGALERLRRHEREELIRLASATVLDPVEQEAVYLRYVEQLPQDRITELLSITEASGARGVLQRCRRKLQRELRRLLGELGHGSSFVRGTLA